MWEKLQAVSLKLVHPNSYSFREYTYVDTEGDVNLDTFALQIEDIEHKVL